MPDEQVIDVNIIEDFLSENYDVKTVNEKLLALGFGEELISKYLTAFNKAKYARRQARGALFCAVGAFLGFIGCLLAILNPLPELYYFSLYGLTSLAAILIFYGLYNFFE